MSTVIARRRIWVRHCEAAKPPKQSRRAGPRVMGGRCAVWPCPILDCFALAPLALAMTGNGGPSLRGGEAAEAIHAGGPASDEREAYIVAAPLLDCFALASLALAMTGNKCRAGLAMTGKTGNTCRSRSQ